MRFYWELALKSFVQNLAYRSEVWILIFSNVVMIFVKASIWKAIFGTSNGGSVGLDEMMTYSIVGTAVSLLVLSAMSSSIRDKLVTGGIAVDFIKPVHFPLYLFADQLGHWMYKFVFQMIPTVCAASLLIGIQPPKSFLCLIGFLLSFLLALAMAFALGYIVSLLGFWFIETTPLNDTLGAMVSVFSGSFLPIWFFSSGWARVASLLPFPYLTFIPTALYMGKIPHTNILPTMGIGVAWVAVLYTLVYLLWRICLRRLVIQGG